MLKSLAPVLLLMSAACASVSTPADPSPTSTPALTSPSAATPAGGPRPSTTDRCTVTVEEVCSPYARDRASCQVDSTRWARATYSGACGGADPEWEIRPDPKTAWPEHEARAFPWHHDSRVGYFRGECGDYLVRVRAPEAGRCSGEIALRLPAPLCDGGYRAGIAP